MVLSRTLAKRSGFVVLSRLLAKTLRLVGALLSAGWNAHVSWCPLESWLFLAYIGPPPAMVVNRVHPHQRQPAGWAAPGGHWWALCRWLHVHWSPAACLAWNAAQPHLLHGVGPAAGGGPGWSFPGWPHRHLRLGLGV